MKKKCLIIQPIIPHYRIKFFSLLVEKFPNQIVLGFDTNSKNLFKNDAEVIKFSCSKISWIYFGSIIIN